MSTFTPITLTDSPRVRADSPTAVVTGAFIQPTSSITAQSAESWARTLDSMAAIGMDTLVVQYVASDDEYFYPSQSSGVRGSDKDAIRAILASAHQSRIKVYLGLQLDHSFWHDRFDARDRIERNRTTLNELWELYGRSPALAGWYLPEEIDNITPTKGYADDLLRYLGIIACHARDKTGLPVMISPFFGKVPNAEAYAKWWDEVALPAVNVDIVALQDGVGTHRTSIDESRLVFAALAPVMNRHKVAFWANNECFDQTHGWPVDDQAWSAQPADIEGFIRQVEASAPYVEKSITFEFCHYLDPERSKKTLALYRGYNDYFRKRDSQVPHIWRNGRNNTEKVNRRP